MGQFDYMRAFLSAAGGVGGVGASSPVAASEITRLLASAIIFATQDKDGHVERIEAICGPDAIDTLVRSLALLVSTAGVLSETLSRLTGDLTVDVIEIIKAREFSGMTDEEVFTGITIARKMAVEALDGAQEFAAERVPPLWRVAGEE